MSNNTPRRTGTINGRPRTTGGPRNPRVARGIDVQHFIDHLLDVKMSRPARVAAALNYAAETAPGAILAYNVVLQMIMGYKHQPRLGTEEVKSLRGTMTAAGKILHEKYGRGKHAVPGVGVRATIDSADRLVTEIPRKRSIAGAAVNSLTKSMAAINIKDVPNTPELKEHRDWFLNNSKNVLDNANDLIKRLLPPKK